MADNYIKVLGKPFFGRDEEQRAFRDWLDRALQPPRHERDPNAPFIFHLFGDGGIGKSSLLNRFHDIAQDEYSTQFVRIFVNWETVRTHHQDLKARANVTPERLFVLLRNEILSKRQEWAIHFASFNAQ